MMRMTVLILGLALIPAPVLAQDEVQLDADLTRTCLAAQAGEDGQPETCIGVAAAQCMEQPGGFTTYGMSACLGLEYDLWDGMLNDSYRRVMAGAEAADAEMADMGSAAPKQVPALREMQRNWIDFRNAACAFENSRWGGGTGGGPASVQCALTLTARQTLWLDQYDEQN